MSSVKKAKDGRIGPGVSSLPELCVHLTKVSSDALEWRKRAGDASKLIERREALVAYHRAARSLLDAVLAIREVKALRPSTEAALKSLAQQQKAIQGLAEKSEQDATYITRPKSFEALRESDFALVEEALLNSWKDYAGAGQQPGVEVVLEKFKGLRSAAKQVSQARAALQRLASVLPRSSADVASCEAAREKLADALSHVEGSGIDAEMLGFLRASFDGVPLEKVLADERILEWIQEHDLAGQFVLRSR